MLVGALTKSAQVPFHFWLPAAMAAPAPVSAYLHSATMVKAGVFLVARLFPVFAASIAWPPLLIAFGLTSFVVAGWNALWTDDVKKLLAYSTIAYLGLLMAHYGYAARVGLRGELVNIANHAFYKAALFLLVGWAEKATGTRDLRTLARERWPPHEPLGTSLLGLGALAMAGSPLLLGFMSKEFFLAAVIGGAEAPVTPQVLVVVLATALSVAYGLKIFMAFIFGSEAPPPDRRHQGPALSPWLLLIPALLLLPQLVGGVAPHLFQTLLEGQELIARGPAIWHRADIMLVISLVSFALGAVFFLFWRRLLRAGHFPFAQKAIEQLTRLVLAVSAWIGRTVQAGGHPRFGVWVLASMLSALVAALVWKDMRFSFALDWGPGAALGWVPGFAAAGAAVLTVVTRRRLAKAVMLSIIGYSVAFYYVLFRAPDLMLTQILVETISLILLLLVFRRLPKLQAERRSRGERVLHALLGLAVGACMTIFAWSAATFEPPARTGQAHLAISEPIAHGRNVVNVILVDFRGADTLGEVIVLVIAALGVVAMALPATRTGLSRGQGR
jgi:multisubunit Na+/H+ antiporter MnhB subunit